MLHHGLATRAVGGCLAGRFKPHGLPGVREVTTFSICGGVDRRFAIASGESISARGGVPCVRAFRVSGLALSSRQPREQGCAPSLAREGKRRAGDLLTSPELSMGVSGRRLIRKRPFG